MDVGVLTVVVLLLAVLTVRAVVRLVRRSATFQGVAVAALALWSVLLVTAGVVELRHHHVQAVATQATRMASGDPQARVVCARAGSDWMDLSGTLGFVRYDDQRTSRLRTSTCSALGSFLWGDYLHGSAYEPSLQEVVALHVVSHEAQHVAGEFDEGVAECLALRWDVRVAEAFGAAQAQAQGSASRYLAEVYPYQAEGYVQDCSAVP
ncbi:hypothetical protein ACTHAM_001899 [Cellulomonas soli]|uniref:hypothetical protein n=1 Tax=Cellulomonas soli TaxID=931535 RepID=UPI003F87A8FA